MEKLGHYYLLETLGAGSTSIVYKAQDRRQGRTVALKVIRSDKAKAHFEREVLLSRNLKHPHISIVERIEVLEDGRVLMVLPFYEGKTLDKLLVPIHWAEALEYIYQVAVGLAHAHAQHLLHCDIKPANLMLAKGQIKILDFGLARLQEDETVFEQLGTLEYMSPEAARGQKLSAGSDLWSLGVVFYEMLTGISPFRSASPMTTLRHIAEKDPPLVSGLRPGLPEGFDLVLQKLLTKKPDQRYSSAEDLLSDLSLLKAGKTLSFTFNRTYSNIRSNPGPNILNLPEKPAIILGREDELALINLYLQDVECRLLTLQGMGGIGKTHLSVWAAHQQATFSQSEYQAIHFVSLVNVSEAGFVAALADVVGVEGNATLDAVGKAIGKRRQLLVLDNFEHLRSRSFMLEQLLQLCPHLTLFVTSRERLALEAEWVIPLRGLSLPSELPAVRDAYRYDALALFAYFAQRQDKHFSLETELERVYSICAQLQGHPLGIRLAVALLKEQSLEEVACQLKDDFKALVHGSGHHASLQAVFEQSYRLLSSEQQDLLASLSIFEGGFELDAATYIVAASRKRLDALLDRSLLEIAITGRYYQHPILQRFSKDIKEPEPNLQHRYQDYFLAQLRRLRAMIKGTQQSQAFKILEQDFANLQKALLQQADWDADVSEPFRAFFTHKGRYSEGYEMFSRAKGDYAQVCAGWFALMLGNLEEAQLLSQPYTNSEDLQIKLIALNTQAGIFASQNQLEQAKVKALETIHIAHQLNDLPMLAVFTGNVAQLEEKMDHAHHALIYYEQSLELSKKVNNDAQTLLILNNLADFYLNHRDLEKAKSLIEEGLLLTEKSNLPRMKPLLQSNLGLCLYAEGDYFNAQAAYNEAFQISLERGDDIEAVSAKIYLGQAQAAEGKVAQGKATLLEALETALKLDYSAGMLSAIVRFAEILERERNPWAKDLAALVLQHPHTETGDRKLAEMLAQSTKSSLTLEDAIKQLLKLNVPLANESR